MRFIVTTLVGCWAIVLGLAGCKSSDTTSPSTTPTNATLAGLWGGTDSDTGDTLSVLISSNNEMVVIRSDGTQFSGVLQVSGDTIVGALDGYTNFGSSFSDNTVFGIGTLDATVVPAKSITATVTFTTTGGTSLPGSWSLTPGTLTGSGSSLTKVSGNFTDNTTGATVSITASGAMSSQNATTGCVLNGTIGTSDTAIDVYQVSYTLANCTGSDSVLNGITYSGLGYLDSTASPATLTYAASGSSGTTSNHGIVSTLTAS